MRLPYKKKQIALEISSIAILVGLIVYAVMQWPHLPDQMPVHFSLSGAIDRWNGKGSLLILIAIPTILYASVTFFSFVPRVCRLPVWSANSESREKVEHHYRYFILLAKLEMVWIFSYIAIHSIHNQPLSSWFLPTALLLLFGLLIWFRLRLQFLRKASAPVDRSDINNTADTTDTTDATDTADLADITD